ncbi:Csf-2 family protein [Salix suchowensis]|nr:Csf-2 family protein [Salix suchowensis]
MTLCGEMEAEVELKVSAETFHDVFSCRPHHVSNMSPAKVQNADLNEGDWGKPGTVISWSYMGFLRLVRTLTIDDVKLSTTFKVIGGDITTEFKEFKFTVQAVGEGSCLAHWTVEYEKLNENVPDPRAMLELFIDISKDIEEHHLTQKPTAQA